MLKKELIKMIKFRGPISVATFMRLALLHPEHGYYARADAGVGSPFGVAGDFTTSPEISNCFGELVAVWLTSVWQRHLGRAKRAHLIELGPGRGTLTADVLRAFDAFGPAGDGVAQAVASVHFVEASPGLRLVQERAMQEFTAPPRAFRWHDSFADAAAAAASTDPEAPLLVVAHEFFDCLPVHIFRRRRRRQAVWNEQLVDLDEHGTGFRFCQSPGPTVAARALCDNETRSDNVQEEGSVNATVVERIHNDEGGQLASRPPPKVHSNVGPAAGPSERPPLGDECREACPDGQALVSEIATALDTPAGGAALIMDYGYDDWRHRRFAPPSLRAIRNHKVLADPLNSAEPGQADVSALVDFGSLRQAALSTTTKVPATGAAAPMSVRVLGPVPQAAFLRGLGFDVRVARLNHAEARSAAERLVSTHPTSGLGETYRALAMVAGPHQSPS